jgi:FAD/FMN-containing dehydrogenase
MLNPADDAFLIRLAQALPEGTLRPVPPAYLEEPRGRMAGRGGVLAVPRRVDEVATIVRLCAAARVGILPWGGGTGLVGGQVMVDGPLPVVLSLERMAAVRGLWADERVMVVEAGAVLADVQAAADRAGLLFPLSLASEGSARIGGLLSTNAGGVGVLRYGNTRDLVLGIEAVLPDGAVFHGTHRLRKDNTGYDLRHLLIGAEGTLGVITAASLRLYAPPAHLVTALLVVPGPAEALRLLALAQGRLPDMVSAFELIGQTGLDFLAEHMPEVTLPQVAPWQVLVELGLPSGMDPEAAMAGLYAEGAEAGLVQDGVIAASAAQRAGLWRIRESIPLANRCVGAVVSHDISVPLGVVPEFLDRAGVALAALGDWRINCFGHLGDGNLHYNVFPVRGRTRADHAGQAEAVQQAVHEVVHAVGGSISAEHGIGRLKVADLERFGDPAKLAAMRAIKAALDPAGIMNPGAVVR